MTKFVDKNSGLTITVVTKIIMKEESNIDEFGRTTIVPGNVYLIQGVNYSEHKLIYEWECLSSSKNVYKFLDKITERVFWIENNEFHDNSFGQGGYYVLDCIYDKRKEIE